MWNLELQLRVAPLLLEQAPVFGRGIESETKIGGRDFPQRLQLHEAAEQGIAVMVIAAVELDAQQIEFRGSERWNSVQRRGRKSGIVGHTP